MSRRGMRVVLFVSLLSIAALAIGVTVALSESDPQPVDFVHNAVNAPAPVTGTVWSNGPNVKTGTAICTTPTSTAANVNTDCEENGPHNETSIAVNPTDPNNIIGGANDYQLSLNPGGHVGEQVLSRAHVSTDGGQTWSEYPLYSSSTYQATGDPSVAFDASGHAYYATLGFRFVGPVNAQNPDVLVANSGDGGKTWSVARVAAGSGVETSVGDLLDKEYVTAWGQGNAIVTFGDFSLAQKGGFVSARIYDSVTHDFGKTWSAPTLISGSLDEAFVATPVVAADGSIYASFLNTTDLTTGRDDYEVVKVSAATGAPLGAPVKVATTIDGATDYPLAFGRQTYQDSLFRTWAAGNIAADPTNPLHLAVVWSDMRNSTLPARTDPYSATTNSDIVVSESSDGGATWSAPTPITLPGDQFMPWAVFDGSGTLRIGFFDRSHDAANHLYGYTLATETSPGVFSNAQVTTALSDPTSHDRWFARSVDSGFPQATAFLGDYSNIAAIPGTSSGIVAYWTDMRVENCWPAGLGCGRHGEDAFFAKTG
jgi:BNR repeat protein/BNR/Asp-box repeat protein